MVLKVCVHEWLSGGVSPCQGEGRGFESRLVLSMIQKKEISVGYLLFCMFEPCRVRTVRMSPLRCGRRSRTSPGRSATSRALKEIEKRVIRWMALFSMFKPCRARTVRSIGSDLFIAEDIMCDQNLFVFSEKTSNF